MLANIIASVISGVSSIFGFATKVKEKQAETIVSGIDAVKTLIETKAESEASAAIVVAAEAQSESVLARNWRPLTMLIFVGLIVARFFGFVPDHMSPTEYERLWDLMEIGMAGYIGSRTIEKIVSQMSLGSVLKRYIENSLIKGK